MKRGMKWFVCVCVCVVGGRCDAIIMAAVHPRVAFTARRSVCEVQLSQEQLKW
jgi:hypothetical protein